MNGPPVEIHIDDAARPIEAVVPSQIPLQWQQIPLQVEDDMKRDEPLGKFPYGEPSSRCHRMVVTCSGGSPR